MSKDQGVSELRRRFRALELVSDFYSEETRLGTAAAVEKLCDSLKASEIWHDADDAAFFDAVAIGSIPSTEVFFHLLEEASADSPPVHA